MERQRIKDEIGALEEQLELLDLAALENETQTVSGEGKYDFKADVMVREALESLRRLQHLVQEEKYEKSLNSQEFLKRVSGVLIREAHASGFDVSISTYGTGRISIEMVEVAMGAILACIRASLRSFKGMGKALRVKNHLFNTFSIYLEVRANTEELQFRLLDDGQGYSGSFRTEFETENQFARIRTHISKFGGWFRRKNFPGHGGTIEFKASLPLSRFECLVLRSGSVEILLPNGCAGAPVSLSSLASGENIAFIDEAKGLTTQPSQSSALVVPVAVADFQFWIACEFVSPAVRARRISAHGLVADGAWFRNFGVYHEKAMPKVLPLMEGEALMNFYVSSWGSNEGV